ncbi:carboxymuconolactone decarboxylase family protein [Shewanella intestini]|uniref:Carboxymuconolactone decarboxylase family protein n=1 Tax=Shewanella intestini TaxID=2017544 RepID=A0ABS5I758_9GAMM|nr:MULTISPECIES: carboxymuconolactone decarboxylase family protein [Shewanella]MBR9729170.1 carboxymuconolactone decarboxylase family protein [Shewanella intestini]MRG37259.1 carboxymuconolactone decarboxylase family protein [Shewanella sp. XMDDZSB0408]
MTTFTIHTTESAPEKSKAILAGAIKQVGVIPGLYGVMAESPEILKAYTQLNQLFTSTSFNAEELTVVWQTINVEHECHYCVPAHTAIAHSMKVDAGLTEALRNQTAMPTEKLQALHKFTLAMVRQRGNVTDEQIAEFFAAGYAQQQVLEIILGLSQKVISNYVNHVAKTPVDPMFSDFAWTK